MLGETPIDFKSFSIPFLDYVPNTIFIYDPNRPTLKRLPRRVLFKRHPLPLSVNKLDVYCPHATTTPIYA